MKKDMTPRKAALLTGGALILMTVVADAVMVGVYEPLFQSNRSTFQSLVIEQEHHIVWGILGWIVIFLTDVLVSWGLYHFYSSRNKKKASIMGLLRLVYSGILGIGVVQLIRSYFSMVGDEPNFAQAHDLLFSFQSIWQLGLIIFGVHLLYLSSLVCKKRTFLQVLAILLFIAGIGYVASNMADLFVENYEALRSTVEAPFILPMVLGEFGLAIWLVVKGGRVPQDLRNNTLPVPAK